MPGYFKNLRKLYGRSPNGSRSRSDIKISLTDETLSQLGSIVEIGKGKYGSPAIELSIRLMLFLMSDGEAAPDFAAELDKAVDNPNFARNLRILSRYLES
jgi:hypothetical protein